MEIIKTPSQASSSYKVSLEGQSYKLYQRFNTRTQSWYLDVYNSDNSPLVLGRKLLPEVPIIVRNLDLMPKGNLTVVQNKSSLATSITRDNLGEGKDYELNYYTLEDLLNAN